ncbi:DUF2612 domain-containing protein [Candidatus Dojkabacteria bacterium]|uniref:DUF2612 domain-containing protein n=1 Tax=Candidatus Dojkabacteria bacterium TaxID=2099670 RepID=A0A5C7J3P1_9BACT|nr:MAG: DUF2612 domain-containing protein [Candidatus Dojkabacteria bacterium]
MTLTEEAESLLLYQFNQSPKLKALIRALVEPFSTADDELHKLHNGHYIGNAKEATLDVIGSIVGQPRYDLSDQDYGPWIKVAICLNNGNGTPENVLNILSILFDKEPPIRMEEYAPNDVIFTFFEIPKFPLTTLFSIVRSAVPITTKCQFIRADPASRPNSGVHVLNATTPLPAFRLDFTSFSACYFADFFEGELS